jgi:hypothetical protein
MGAHAQLIDLSDAPTYVDHSPGDGYAARLRGFAAVTVSCRESDGHVHPGVEENAIERAEAFCVQLITRLDAELGLDLATAVSSSD